MNKTILSIIAIASLFFMVACGEKGPDTVEAKPEADTAQASSTSATYAVDGAASTLEWIGRKQVGQDMHQGTIAIQSGSMSVEGGNLTAGNFVVDMTAITVTDQTPDEKKGYLVGHLQSDDFFNAEAFPTATFAVTKVEAATDDSTATHHISGNLTIRDVTKEITIPANVTISEDKITTSSSFAINRADFNVKYGSATHIVDITKDKIINDELEFNLSMVANKQVEQATK
jgi:polyisoprenoid-binding protein YceI